MRFLTLTLALVLLPLASMAQDAPTSQPAAKPATLRVGLDGEQTVDGEPLDQNTIQAFAFGELHKFGIRIDSLKKTGIPAFDKWLKSTKANWEKRDPDAPGASLVITARQKASYNGAKFYGETQAHVYKGGMEVEIKDGAGETVASFAYTFQWGKAVRRKMPDGSVETRTKPQVMRKFDELLQKTMVVGILAQPAVRAGIPKTKLGKLDKYLKKTRTFLLKNLETKTEAVKNGELARFLRGLPLDTK
jgi:hypothetical protein